MVDKNLLRRPDNFKKIHEEDKEERLQKRKEGRKCKGLKTTTLEDYSD